MHANSIQNVRRMAASSDPATVKMSQHKKPEEFSPSFTPALTATSQGTPSVAATDDPFLSTPVGVENTSGDSFLFPSRSFEIEHYTNLKDVVPEWDDDEVDEIVVLSPKRKAYRTLSVIEEAQETQPSVPCMASFQQPRVLDASSTSVRVCAARHSSSGKLYAVKTFMKSLITYDTPALEKAMKEQMMLRLLTQLGSRFILRLRWSFQDSEAMHLVTDLCECGDLGSYIKSHGSLLAPYVRVHAAELADALCSLHDNGVLHRSISPDHILLDKSGHIVLSGFSNASASSTYPSKPASASYTSAIPSQDKVDYHEFNIWSAPEIVLGWAQDPAVDWWSFGLVLWYMLTGDHPLIPENVMTSGPSTKVLEAYILHGSLPWINDKDSVDGEHRDANSLIFKCLQRNGRLRPSAEMVRRDAYFVNIDWVRLRGKQYTVPLASPPPEHGSSPLDDLGEIPESETLRGVHIAGFNFAHDEEPEEHSRVDLSEGELTKPEDHNDSTQSIELDPKKDSPGLQESNTNSRRTTYTGGLESNYMTPMGSVSSNANSETSRGSAPSASTALYSCTSFGELRGCSGSTVDSAEKTPLVPTHDSGNDMQCNKADKPAPLLVTNYPGSGPLSGLIRPDHIRRNSTPAPPSILVRRDTMDSSGSNLSRPGSSLGGARGLRLRKYASLNFDLDTITSLELDYDHEQDNNLSFDSFSHRPRSAAASRRVSFVDAFNPDSSITSASVSVNAQSPEKADVSPAPYTAPIGGGLGQGSPWSLKNLNNFKIASPTGSATGANMQNKLRKKQRTSSTPVLSNTPHLQQKADLPTGVQQIGLGIGYTYTRPPGAILDRTPVQPEIPSTPRRSTSTVGTTGAIQRCSAIFANLGRHAGRVHSKTPQTHTDASADRMSEESDALEAVMREMYGTAWNSESGHGYGGLSYAGGGSGGGASGRKPGRVYSVPGISAVTGALAMNPQAGSSTVRLVEQPRERESR